VLQWLLAWAKIPESVLEIFFAIGRREGEPALASRAAVSVGYSELMACG